MPALPPEPYQLLQDHQGTPGEPEPWKGTQDDAEVLDPFWLENLVAHKQAVMLCGPAGTGKTQLVMGLQAFRYTPSRPMTLSQAKLYSRQ